MGPEHILRSISLEIFTRNFVIIEFVVLIKCANFVNLPLHQIMFYDYFSLVCRNSFLLDYNISGLSKMQVIINWISD
jgi:hypothetical protein